MVRACYQQREQVEVRVQVRYRGKTGIREEKRAAQVAERWLVDHCQRSKSTTAVRIEMEGSGRKFVKKLPPTDPGLKLR